MSKKISFKQNVSTFPEYLSFNSVARLECDGFVSIDRQVYEEQFLGTDFDSSLEVLQESFKYLEPDRFMEDGGRYRFRSFSKFHYNPNTMDLVNIPGNSFFQSEGINSLNGGVSRVFAPMKHEAMNNPIFYQIFLTLFARLPEEDKNKLWLINVHQIRIIACRGESGRPSPEGIH